MIHQSIRRGLSHQAGRHVQVETQELIQADDCVLISHNQTLSMSEYFHDFRIVDMRLCTFDSVTLAGQILDQNEILFSKIATALECDKSEVAVALSEVLRFLYLASVNEHGMLTPSARVDLAWHEFILCTRAYEQFCQEQFSRFIHHTPGGSRTNNRQQFRKTLECYESTFGNPQQHYWGTTEKSHSSCGECESF
ncbi:MAG: glycine-rich domain-containing protein [Rubripirellula sp.]